MRDHVAISHLSGHVGGEVTLRGWLTHKRDKGKIRFLVMRDGSGICQCVASTKDVSPEVWDVIGSLTLESSFEARGTVREDKRAPGGFELGLSSVRAFRQAVTSSATALEATEAGYEVGTRTAVDVLNSRRELFRSVRDYARSRYTYILETLRLKAAVGTLTEQDVAAINNWLK